MNHDDFQSGAVKINTGNNYADLEIEHRLAHLPEFWALVAYFESKGILNREEFYECLNQKCTQSVEMANILQKDEQET